MNFSAKKSTHVLKIGLFIVAFFGLQVFSTPRAHAWGDAIPAELMHQAWQTIYDNYLGVLLGTAKTAAIQAVNQQVAALIGGGGNGLPLIITNWNNFLYQTPLAQTNLYMNDLFTLTTRGKFSTANYLGVGDASGAISNYPGYIVNQAKQLTVDQKTAVYNLDEYAPNPNVLFETGNWQGLHAYFSPMNNVYGSTIQYQMAYLSENERNQEIAKVKAQSSGFLGVEKNGVTVTPAAAIQALTTNIQNLPNLSIASATSAAELASGVAMAMANRMVSQLVQQGIASVGAGIQKQVSTVTSQAQNALKDATKDLGPAAPYVNKAIQQGINQTKINVLTPSPPAADSTSP